MVVMMVAMVMLHHPAGTAPTPAAAPATAAAATQDKMEVDTAAAPTPAVPGAPAAPATAAAAAGVPAPVQVKVEGGGGVGTGQLGPVPGAAAPALAAPSASVRSSGPLPSTSGPLPPMWESAGGLQPPLQPPLQCTVAREAVPAPMLELVQQHARFLHTCGGCCVRVGWVGQAHAGGCTRCGAAEGMRRLGGC